VAEAEKKASGALLAKAIAGFFTLVIAPILVYVGTKWVDPSTWKSSPPTQAARSGDKRGAGQREHHATAKEKEGDLASLQNKGGAEAQDVGAAADPVIHFVGPRLSESFYSYAVYPEKQGATLHNDTVDNRLFQYVDMPPAIHATGALVGGLFSKKVYANYTLIVEYRWSDPPANSTIKAPRQAAIHLHATGTDGEYQEPWMQAIACLLTERQAGSLRLMGDPGKLQAQARLREVTTAGQVRRSFEPSLPAKPVVSGTAGWDYVLLRAPTPVRQAPPADGWNKLEIDCKDETITVRVNGQPVNELTGVSQKAGRIVLTAEGSDLWFRKVDLEPFHK
jgi:hypothetical protein